MSTPCPLLLWLDGLGPALAGPNTDHVLDRGDEDLPVPDPPGARTADDRIDDFRHALIRDQHGDLHLGQEIDDVLRAAVELRVTLLPPEPLPPRARVDEDLPVPDPPGARPADDRIDDFRH